jgi:hypothetical protein
VRLEGLEHRNHRFSSSKAESRNNNKSDQLPLRESIHQPVFTSLKSRSSFKVVTSHWDEVNQWVHDSNEMVSSIPQ